jgi:hypothetical protein
MLGQPESEHHRFRVGLMFLIIGVLLLLWAWGSWLFRTAVPGESTPARESSIAILPAALAADPASIDPEQGLARASLLLMTLLLLLIVGSFGAYAAVIAVRRHRELMRHKRAAPTANADVWAMHRLPDDEDY